MPAQQKEDIGSQTVAVYLCGCKGHISGRVDVEEVARRISVSPNAKSVISHEALCSSDGRASIKESVSKHPSDRVVIAACSPEVIDTPLAYDFEQSGTNKYLVEQVDIREQCAWVHPDAKAATAKAIALISGGIQRSLKQEPLDDLTFPVEGAALILGAGEAGSIAAQRIAESGFKAHVIDKSSKVAGDDSQIDDRAVNSNCKECRLPRSKECPPAPASEVLGSSNGVQLLLDSEIEEIGGGVGKWHIVARTPEGKKEFDVGAILITAPPVHRFSDSLQQSTRPHPRVVTSTEFETLLAGWEGSRASGEPSADVLPTEVCFIQGFDSTIANDRSSCEDLSSIAGAVPQARRLKKVLPEAKICIFCHKLPSSLGSVADLFDITASDDIQFVQSSIQPDILPQDDRVHIRAKSAGTGESIDVECEYAVIVSERGPSEETRRVLDMLHVGRGEGRTVRHLLDRHLPELNRAIFVLESSLGQEQAICAVKDVGLAADVMIGIMRKKITKIPRIIARVEEFRCRGCGKCRDVCEYDAISLVERDGGIRVAHIDESRCEGCGLCRVACCNGSMALLGYTTTQLLANMMGIIDEVNP